MSNYRLQLLAIILFAFALRLHNLTYHSLWFDESISVYWAKQTIPRILEVGFTLVEDRLPPLYYLMLKSGINLFGLSEFSVRILSVFFGLLLVPVIMSLATRLFNRQIALTAGLLVAVNPFLIWYSQEARMYAPAVLFATLTVWSFLRVNESTIYFLLLIFFAIAALYSHLYTAFLLPAMGVWLIISYPRQWKLWLMFGGCALLITLAYAPILWATWQFSSEATPGDPFNGFWQRLWALLQAFTIWKAPLSDTLKLLIPTIMGLLALLQIIDFQQFKKFSSSTVKNPILLVTLLLIFPFLIATMLLFRNHLAFFGERYFIEMTPWFLLLLAVGAARGNRYFSIATSSCLIALFLISLPGQWSIPATKEAWRQSVAYLADHAAPNDAILIHPDWVRYPFQFYFRGPGQTYAAFSNVTPQTELDGPMQGVVGEHPIVWLIQSHLDAPDPRHLVEQWLAVRYPLVTELYPSGISLKGYAVDYQLNKLPSVATLTHFQFKNGLELVGYQADKVVSATDELFHPPSGWVHVVLYWRANHSVTTESTPFVHLVGAAGVWGISLDRESDSLKFYPPFRWTKEQIIRHDIDVNLNPTTPTGEYQLMVGFPEDETQYPLSVVEVMDE